MYTGRHAQLRPLQPAFIMASTGEAVTYRELEARSNRLAHLFRHRLSASHLAVQGHLVNDEPGQWRIVPQQDTALALHARSEPGSHSLG